MKEYLTLNNIKASLSKLQYKIFDDKINITVIRSNEQHGGKFDDYLVVHSSTEIHLIASCTADPSDLYLEKPMSKLGCAILTFGQHIDKWCIGTHKTYTALVQYKPLTVVRDYNKDNILDYTRPLVYDKIISKSVEYNKVDTWYKDGVPIFIEETGIFGLNIHRASQYSVISNIGLYSAACMVIQNPKDFDTFMTIIKSYRDVNNNRYSLNLISENILRSVISSIDISTIPTFIVNPNLKNTNTVDDLTHRLGIRK